VVGEVEDASDAASGDASEAGSAPVTDAVADAAEAGLFDDAGSCSTWHPRFFDPCALPTPSSPITLLPAVTLTYDTDARGFVETPLSVPPR
jgi:hypothetical protein